MASPLDKIQLCFNGWELFALLSKYTELLISSVKDYERQTPEESENPGHTRQDTEKTHSYLFAHFHIFHNFSWYK